MMIVRVVGLVLMMIPMILGWTRDAGAQETRIIVSFDEAAGSNTDLAVKKLAELVQARTQGRVRFDIYPKMALSGGNIMTMIEQTKLGGVHLSLIPTSVYTNFDPRANLYSLPFLFRGIDEARELYNGPVGEELQSSLVEKNSMRGLATWPRLLRELLNNRRPVEQPADLKGLKIRVPETKLYIATFKRLGADPTPMPFGEVPTALKLGTIDGMETPTGHIVSEKFYELVKYVTLWKYSTDALILAANMPFFDGLPKDVQQIIRDAAREAGDYKYQLEVKAEQEVAGFVSQRGVKVTQLTPQQAQSFQAAIVPVWGEFEAQIGKDLIQKANAVLERYRQKKK